jgi:hypothetical protein
MSYDLEVWKETKPISTREAFNKIIKYWEEGESVFLDHPDVELFAREIVEIFPFEVPEHQKPIWSGFDETKAFISMNLGFSHVSNSLPKILEIAAKYELVCYDGQQEIVYYPPSLAEMGYLRLSNSLNKVIDYPAETEIQEQITKLHLEKNNFLILEKKNQYYMQTKIDDNGKTFTIEYRDGSEDKHFHSLNVSREEVTQAFIEYSKNEMHWMKRFDWKKLKLSH